MSAFTERARRRAINTRVQNRLRPIENAYVRVLRNVAKAYSSAYASAIAPHFASITGQKQDADSGSLPNELDLLGAKVQLAIPRIVGPNFDRMSKRVEKASREELSLFGLNPAIGNATLQRKIAQARDANIQLIENAHRVYAQQVRQLVDDPQNFGMRVETLRDKILERGDVSESRAELIARDQTLKLNGAIVEERQRANGVSEYEWSTCRDDRVREEHAALEGQVFSWDNPPEPGHPGEDFQCRCVAIPKVSELDDIFG